MKNKKKMIITLPEYQRIFRVIHSVHQSVDAREVASCLFYNTIGALLIEKCFGIEAAPRMGAGFIRVGSSTDPVLSFAELSEDGGLQSSTNAFHCWVETESHVIDFTAPLYEWYFAKLGMKTKMPNKMFQKQKSDMAASHHHLENVGDFYLLPDLELTAYFLQNSIRTQAMDDLAQICMQWFTRPPKSIKNSFTMMNETGKIIPIQLRPVALSGTW
ncbi:MAG: DUF2026 domain-containing protein [Burkholderiaceae bacterium]|nr:DUF2026 domain-containing protein [Burkholderiaceae bacterium]